MYNNYKLIISNAQPDIPRNFTSDVFSIWEEQMTWGDTPESNHLKATRGQGIVSIYVVCFRVKQDMYTFDFLKQYTYMCLLYEV